MNFIDSHCHIVMSAFDEDREALLRDYFESGGIAMMSVSTSPDEFQANRELMLRDDRIYTALGWHPHDASTYNRQAEGHIREAVNTGLLRAVGEIGLDYHYLNSTRADQIRAFEQQMALAGQLKLPVIIHTREAEPDTAKILRKYRHVTGVLHCYTSGPDLLETGLELDYYVSFSGIITFPRSNQLKELVSRVPIDRILFETDAPYLAPVPFRGKRNDPAKVRSVIEYAADLIGMPAESLSEQANRNFFQLFGEPDRLTV